MVSVATLTSWLNQAPPEAFTLKEFVFAEEKSVLISLFQTKEFAWMALARVPAAKDLFVAMEETGKDPAVLVEERGLKQVTDTGAIEAAIKAVVDANPGQVTAYKAKPGLFGWFVGQVMKSTGGKANPKVVNELLK